MKYIQNKGRYAITFKVMKDEREVRVDLDKRRVYLDTGNIATTGITQVDDDTFALLEESKEFKAYIDNGTFEVLSEEVVKGSFSEADKLVAENEELKAKLAEAEKKAKKAGKEGEATSKKELEEKEKEIADLKAKLEALAGNKDEF